MTRTGNQQWRVSWLGIAALALALCVSFFLASLPSGHAGLAFAGSGDSSHGVPQIAVNRTRPADDDASDDKDDDQSVIAESIQSLVDWRYEAWVMSSDPRQTTSSVAALSGRGPPSLL